jgi:hypothetical protein
MNVSPFYKLEIFIPTENVDELLETLAAVHAGRSANMITVLRSPRYRAPTVPSRAPNPR